MQRARAVGDHIRSLDASVEHLFDESEATIEKATLRLEEISKQRRDTLKAVRIRAQRIHNRQLQSMEV